MVVYFYTAARSAAAAEMSLWTELVMAACFLSKKHNRMKSDKKRINVMN